MKTFATIAALFISCSPALAATPDLLLAQEFKGQNVTGWAMSEKLDGVRAYWNGKQLISRQGYPFTPPPIDLDAIAASWMGAEVVA